MLGGAGVQLRSRGQSALAQSREIDPRYPYPFGFGGGPGLLSDPLLDFRDGTELHERLHRFVPRHADGVHMSFDKAWHDRFVQSLPVGARVLDLGCGGGIPIAAILIGQGFEVTGVDTPIPLNERCLLIGRRETCDIVISDDAVSTAHAVIFEMDGQRFVRDLGSRTGTFVNGKQVHQSDLSLGDTIRIGAIDLKYVPVEVAVEESASDLDELDHLVRTDNLGTDAMAAAAADDITEAQKRAAARSMKRGAEAEVDGEPELEPVPVDRPEDSLDVIPIEEIGLEDTAAAAPDEAISAANAPLPAEVEALEELTVDDLMDGTQSMDDIAPVTEAMQVTAEPEPPPAPQPEPIAKAPAPTPEGRGGVKPFDGNLSILDLPEPEIPTPARMPLGEAGPLEMAPPVNLNAPAARTPFREKPIVEGEAPLAREDDDLLVRGRSARQSPDPFASSEDLTPAAEAPAEQAAPQPVAPEPFDLDDVLGLAPSSPVPAPAEVPAHADEVEAAPSDVEELEPLAVQPVETEPVAAELPEETIAPESVELEPIPVEPIAAERVGPLVPEPVAGWALAQLQQPRSQRAVAEADSGGCGKISRHSGCFERRQLRILRKRLFRGGPLGHPLFFPVNPV